MLSGLIWDFDGTIVDTETPQFRAWSEIFAEYGDELTAEDWGRMVGTWSDVELIDILVERVPGVPRLKTNRRAGALVTQYIMEAPLRPGVMSLMEAARSAQIPQAIASSSHRDWIQAFLQLHHVESYFRALATADDVAMGKPDPAVYRVALSRLSIGPEQAVAIEDSPHGSSAALGAGLKCVVVPNPSTEALTFPDGVVRLPTLEGVTLDALTAF